MEHIITPQTWHDSLRYTPMEHITVEFNIIAVMLLLCKGYSAFVLKDEIEIAFLLGNVSNLTRIFR